MKKIILSILGISLITSCSSDDEGQQLDDCANAISAVFPVLSDFESATSENYEETCIAYREALENQLQACGDEEGNLQATIDGLGDCTDPSDTNTEGEITVTAGTLAITFDIVSVEIEDNRIKVFGETSVANQNTIYFEVEEGVTGENAFEVFEIFLLNSIFLPFENEFNNTVTINSDGEISGSFNGVVVSDNEGALNLTGGSFELSY
ncbi:MAG: hypothetical protein LAT51_06980 [Flavobacteriaceae bacterium]|nr:hypothetical protein [Flavobacteriaceae bacterium]